jgi:hypothetical protein
MVQSPWGEAAVYGTNVAAQGAYLVQTEPVWGAVATGMAYGAMGTDSGDPGEMALNITVGGFTSGMMAAPGSVSPRYYVPLPRPAPKTCPMPPIGGVNGSRQSFAAHPGGARVN